MPSGWASLKKSASLDSSAFGEGASEADQRSTGQRQSRGSSPDVSGDPPPPPPPPPHGADMSPSSVGNGSMSPTYLTLNPNASMYVVTGSPPPLGQGAPRTPNEFLNISVGTTRKNADATGKEVIWYDITIRTTTHQWTVSKRFSDFAQVHETLKKLRLEQFMTDVHVATGGGKAREVSESARSHSASTSGRNLSRGRSESASPTLPPPPTNGSSGGDQNGNSGLRLYRHSEFPPPFPSRFSFRSNMDSTLVEKRRLQLDVYWAGVLVYLQALTIAAIGIKKPYSAALRSAFAVMSDFLRSSSQTESTETGLWLKDDAGPYTAAAAGGSLSSPSQKVGARGGTSTSSPTRGGGGGGGAAVFGSPLASSSKMIFGSGDDLVEQLQPPCKIILEAKTRFTIVFFLPGILLGDVYVDATGDRDRAVVIGGRWNRNIAGLESLREQGVFHNVSQHQEPQHSAGSGSGGRSVESMASSTMQHQQQQQQRGGGSSRRAPERSVLMDTLPRGEFEMVFDVPLPFERAHWYSEYEGGVLLIMWDAPTGTTPHQHNTSSGGAGSSRVAAAATSGGRRF